MKYLESYKFSQIRPILEQSSDWLRLDSLPFRNDFELIYTYKYTKSKKWNYLICVLKEGSNYILYLWDSEDDSVNFLSYLNDPFNRYHKNFINSYGLLDGSVKYFKLQEKVLDFFNSLPDNETIEEWFTYLGDEFKISSIETGFIDYECEYSLYNVIDTNSSNPVICVSFESKDINQEEVNISDYKSKEDYKKNKKFVSNNPKFMLELSSVINRASYYLGDNYKNYEDYKIYILSWGVVQVIIEFKKF